MGWLSSLFRSPPPRAEGRIIIPFGGASFDGSPCLRLLPESFIVADIETTGFSPKKHEIIEVAAIRVNRDGDEHETFSALVRPKQKVPPTITRVTGISQRDVDRQGQPIHRAIVPFLDFVGDRLLVFYNSPFDMGFLTRAAKAAGRELQNPVVDVLPLAREAFPGRKSYRLTSLAKDEGFEAGSAHRALVDCQVTLKAYVAIVQRLGRFQ